MKTVTEEMRRVYVVRLASGKRRSFMTERAAYRAAAWAVYKSRDPTIVDTWWDDHNREVSARLARWLKWRDQQLKITDKQREKIRKAEAELPDISQKQRLFANYLLAILREGYGDGTLTPYIQNPEKTKQKR